MEHQLQKLKKALTGELNVDLLHKTLYATDASVYKMKPLAVAFPKDVEDIQLLVKFATKNKTNLIPRTAGTSLAGQCVGNGIVVDVSKHFTKIISVDEAAKTVTVQPGVIRDELNAYLEKYNLFFGPNTSTSNRCMIGGMVGNNSSGTTSIQYGVTRDKVVAMDVVLSNGDLATFTNLSLTQLHKKLQENTFEASLYRELHKSLSSNALQEEIKLKFPKKSIHRRNTGYAVDALLDADVYGGTHPFNLCKLLTGSEGTLAFTTAITLQLDPLPPPHTAMLVTHYHTLQDSLLDVVTTMQHELFTCELMDDVILDCTKENSLYKNYRDFVKGNPKALLMLELKASSPQLLQNKITALLKAIETSGKSYYTAILQGNAIANAVALRKAGLGLLGNMVGDNKAVACIEDTAVALEDLPAYIDDFTKLMARYNQKAVYYAHAGAGELHLRPILNLKSLEGVKLFREITTSVAHLVKKYNGSFSGEHGDGIVRAEFIKMLVGETNYSFFETIKNTFDPNNIFNPGKIVNPYPMDKNLRNTPGEAVPQINTFMDFSDSQGIIRLAEKCNGSGDCRKQAQAEGVMCPSYHATKDEKHTTRGRANMLREALSAPSATNAFNSEELKEVFDLCISCKACATECPSNVDMATAKAEFLYQYNLTNKTSLSTKLFANSTAYNKRGARFKLLANALFKNTITGTLIKKIVGVAPQRSLPLFDPFKQHQLKPTRPNGRQVYLFVDEFSQYFEGSIVMDAHVLLTQLGYEVIIIKNLDSARALISKGFLDQAKIEIDKNIAFLQHKITAQTPLLGIEPSAILGFRDEYKRIATNTNALASFNSNCLLVEEFLANEMAAGTIQQQQFTEKPQRIKIHVHCHQKALSNSKYTFDVLNFPKNYTPSIITSGCCGMAGSFGYEKAHYAVSMNIGALKLFPAIKKTDSEVLIAANGTSCRHQIKDGTKKTALHPITILRRALV